MGTRGRDEGLRGEGESLAIHRQIQPPTTALAGVGGRATLGDLSTVAECGTQLSTSLPRCKWKAGWGCGGRNAVN